MEEFKGLIPEVLAHNVSYEPQKFTIEMFNDLCKREDELYWQRMKNGWKPEYILGRFEAEEWPLGWLEWLGENYRVLCSLEILEIVRKREENEKT